MNFGNFHSVLVELLAKFCLMSLGSLPSIIGTNIAVFTLQLEYANVIQFGLTRINYHRLHDMRQFDLFNFSFQNHNRFL